MPKAMTAIRTNVRRVTPYGLGLESGTNFAGMMQAREDLITCALEWYRGFCDGSGKTPDPAFEDYLRAQLMAEDAKVQRMTRGLSLVSVVDYLNQGPPPEERPTRLIGVHRRSRTRRA